MVSSWVSQQDPASQILADAPAPQNQAVQTPIHSDRLGRGPILTFHFFCILPSYLGASGCGFLAARLGHRRPHSFLSLGHFL